ncbi:hypothetical protein ACFE04_031501 [Oxalis oulophora]
MSLTSVKMCEEVWLTCMTHALSTEKEEIMGLLLGDIQYSKNGNVTALIWAASPQPRCCRQKDRVETNPEQLAAASAQAMYQLLDPGFIGLIFSCFSEDVNKVGRIQVIAFQSSGGGQNQNPRPIAVSPVNGGRVIDLESSLSSSENISVRSGFARTDNTEQDTASSQMIASSSQTGTRSKDLSGFFAHADSNFQGRDRTGGNYYNDPVDRTSIVEIDPMDLSEGMQEAMHRSTLDMSEAEYNRKEVPLMVLPTKSLLKLDSPLKSFTDLQHVLFEEEQAEYNQAILQNMTDGKIHPLTYIHHTSTYQASLCKLMEYCLSPAMNALQDRLRDNEIRLAKLKEEAKFLESEASKVSKSSVASPRQVSSHTTRGSASSSPRDLPHSPSEHPGVRPYPVFGSRSRKSPQ